MTRSERRQHDRPAVPAEPTSPLPGLRPAGAAAGAPRIAVDLLGGDDAPAVVVDGALRACGADLDVQLLLVGPAAVAEEVVAALAPADRGRVRTLPVDGAVAMADSPLRGLRRDTSVRAAVDAVAEGAADAMVSAGASGAAVTAAVHGLGRLPGIRRPALAATVPTPCGPVLLLDVGATTEPHTSALVQHAVLGAGYARVVNAVPAPRVGLLSIGTEPGKGDKARRHAATSLADPAALPADARFVGTVEGFDVPRGGAADVVVTDGFTGNVLLKGLEGAYEVTGGTVTVPRAAALLGVCGTVVICHGAAVADDVASGILLAAALHRAGGAARLARWGEPA